jgi:hypothetical protein
LPEALHELDASRSLGEVCQCLEKLGARVGLAAIELLSPGTKEPAWAWTSAENARNVSARFPLGSDAAARAEVKFSWQSDTAQVPEATNILMLLAADALERTYVRLGSAYAPESSPSNTGADDMTSALHAAPVPAIGQRP